MEIVVVYQGRARALPEPLRAESPVVKLCEAIARTVGVPVTQQKIIHRSKVIFDAGQADTSSGTGEMSSLEAAGVRCESAAAVRVLLFEVHRPDDEQISAVRNFSADRTLAPFHNERGEAPAHSVRSTHASVRSHDRNRSSPFTFGSLHTLPGLAEENRAMELLEQLKNDRGIAAVMREHRWHVGALREMYPKGKVGVDPVCVLGYNVNQGAEIHLRLRTDDMRGFRPMYKLREVLFHELSHNVHAEHDQNFYELMRQLQREAERLDWTKSAGRSTGEAEGGVDRRAASVQLPSAAALASAAPPAPPRPPPPPGGNKLGGGRDAGAWVGGARAAAGRAAMKRLAASSGSERATSSGEAAGSASAHGAAAAKSDAAPSSKSAAAKREDVAATQHAPTELSSPDVSGHGSSGAVMEGEGFQKGKAPSVAGKSGSSLDAPPPTAGGSSPKDTSSAAREDGEACATMAAMGFGAEEIRCALASCEGNVERAANWIVSRRAEGACSRQDPEGSTRARGDAFAGGDLRVAGNGARDEVEGRERSSEARRELVAMGFSDVLSRRALRSNNDDLSAAINWLLSREAHDS